MTHIHTATRPRTPDAQRPRVVSVLSQESGTGKTTLSCALAALASRSGTATAVLDLDPLASAAKWHDLRRANGEEDPPVFATPSSRPVALVESLRWDGAELIVAATSPHSRADVVTVARLSDHIRIPHQPSFPDLAAITRTIDIAEVAIAPATIVLKLALVNHPGADDAQTVIETTVVVRTLSVSEALKQEASLRLIERATEDSS
ncbi:MAG: ParA family protein [Thiotrichales bacterium]|nr:ParA family protein [Thiotrichales bacterium]